MASTNKTPNLNLPQWELSDKSEMADFNNAFSKVDTTVATHMAESATNAHTVDNIKGLHFRSLFWESTLINGWTAFGGVGVEYRPNDQGFVQLRMNVRPNAVVTVSNNHICSVAVGYQPSVEVCVPYFDSVRGMMYNGIIIHPDGKIKLNDPAMGVMLADGVVRCEVIYKAVD